MTAEQEGVRRCHELLGRPVYDRSGRYLGRVADLVVRADEDGRYRLVEAMVSPRPWGRLLGYERPDAVGPWPLELLARWIVRRKTRRVPWAEIRFTEDPHSG
jgi:sporulation protein YlmC with PRC-barrel domain